MAFRHVRAEVVDLSGDRAVLDLEDGSRREISAPSEISDRSRDDGADGRDMGRRPDHRVGVGSRWILGLNGSSTPPSVPRRSARTAAPRRVVSASPPEWVRFSRGEGGLGFRAAPTPRCRRSPPDHWLGSQHAGTRGPDMLCRSDSRRRRQSPAEVRSHRTSSRGSCLGCGADGFGKQRTNGSFGTTVVTLTDLRKRIWPVRPMRYMVGQYRGEKR
jgi:hypothetical protein